jgi:hypothetical protein
MQKETKAIHAGYEVDSPTGAVAVPVYQTVASASDRAEIVNADCAAAPPRVRSRQITDIDLMDVVDLLARGYSAQRSRKFWQHVMKQLASRPVPAGYPRYGYVLESNGKLVGVFLQIFSRVLSGGKVKTRCNVMSVYVDPKFRVYAPMFELQTFKYNNVTVLDVTPAPSRYAVVEARGYTRYSNGLFIALPALSRLPNASPVRILGPGARPDVLFDAHERDMLLEHAGYGCLSLWCVTRESAHPFIFRPRFLKGFVRCAQLVYCHDIDDFVRFARPIGLFLARRLQLLVMVDANGPVGGLVGKYFPGKMPRYFRGPDEPRLGDLAYTEIALFGT